MFEDLVAIFSSVQWICYSQPLAHLSISFCPKAMQDGTQVGAILGPLKELMMGRAHPRETDLLGSIGFR